MAKAHTTLSIEPFILEQAKSKGINLSFELEKAIKSKCYNSINDVPKENLKIKCSNCSSIVDFGFLCVKSNQVFCENCNIERFRLMNGDKGERFCCKIAKEHEHIRIPGLEGQHADLLEKVTVEVSNE